ncbi:hypothetical protein GJAV_G00144020 [Gymnothorax javanicus]|nr:hypothetical protein GJAV_G00144020 [Gymnothorax javanicus]
MKFGHSLQSRFHITPCRERLAQFEGEENNGCTMALQVVAIVACVLLLFTEHHEAIQCKEVPGRLKQIDAGLGLVFGVHAHNSIFTLLGETWVRLPGALKHVSVGPAGVWGTNCDNNIFRLVAGKWVQVSGKLVQVDAGGDQFVAGVDHIDRIFCMNQEATVTLQNTSSPAPWKQLPGGLMYYSCGPLGCWGVARDQLIYFREGVTPRHCSGEKDWQQIDGQLVMVEVSTDGHVYGVNAGGEVFHRDGVTLCKPEGTCWTKLDVVASKHVSYDLGHLWLITPDDKILDCLV